MVRAPRRTVGGALFALAMLLPLLPVAAFAGGHEVTLRFFSREGCPACERMKPALERLAAEHRTLTVVEHDVGASLEDARLFAETAARFGIAAPNVPAVFIGAGAWVGFTGEIERAVAAAVAACVEEGCPDPLAVTLADTPARPTTVSSPLFGTLQIDRLPLIASTLVIAAVDGFNPCSLWVLTFLLGMVIHSGSRRRVLLVGLIFLTVTSAIYGLFIVGVVQVLALVSHLGWIRYAVSALAFAAGAINVKDFFAWKRGPSLTLPDAGRRRFAERTRALWAVPATLPGLAATTVVLAAGISIMELPCTAGFPVVWSQLVTSAQPTRAAFLGLLALYLAVYLLDELIVLGSVAVVFRRVAIAEKHGRFLKLLGGAIMVVLAAMMAIAPAALESLAGMAAAFGAAVAAAFAVAIVHRMYRERRTGVSR